MNWRDTLTNLRQKAFPRARALEQALSGLQAEHDRVLAELDAVRTQLSDTRVQDAAQQAELKTRLAGIDAERHAATLKVDELKSALDEAGVRQRGAEEQIRSLQARLDENRDRYESSIELTQETLHKMQDEQQQLLSLQSELAHTFHDVGRQLLESTQAQQRSGLSGWQTLLLAGLMFLSGLLASSVLLREPPSTTVNLAPLESGVAELQDLVRRHFESHDRLLSLLTTLVEREQARPGVSTPPPVPATSLGPRQAAELRALGFAATPAALAAFRDFYAPLAPAQGDGDDSLDDLLTYFASQARADQARYGKDSGVLAAIRLASLRTGIDYGFLMELAAIESNFNAGAVNRASAATGLYQFRDASWLDAVHDWGSEYGLANHADAIEYVIDAAGISQPVIKDAALRERVLALRTDARLSALLAAELARKSMRRLTRSLEREPGRTELYLSHFFGTSGAIAFLKARAEDPGRLATELFPGPAERNRAIFLDQASKPRTVEQIYRLFARRFDTRRYSDS